MNNYYLLYLKYINPKYLLLTKLKKEETPIQTDIEIKRGTRSDSPVYAAAADLRSDIHSNSFVYICSKLEFHNLYNYTSCCPKYRSITYNSKK